MAAALHSRRQVEDGEGITDTEPDKLTQGNSSSTCKDFTAAATAAKRIHTRSLYHRVHHQLRKLKSWLWSLIEELLEEFQPWLKWIIFDALLTLLVGQLVKHVGALRPLFEAIGWA